MRVIFFGTPSFAVPTLARLIDSRHSVVGVVTQPDRARGRGQRVVFSPVKDLARSHGLPVLQPTTLNAEDVLRELLLLNADIGVVAAYGRILPQSVLDIPARGLINVHASLLPRWRGAAPIHRAIQAGDGVTGVTIMRVVLALDAGPMLSRVEVPIVETDNAVELERALAAAGADLLVKTLDDLDSRQLPEIPQDETLVTYAKKIERGDGRIDWTRPAREIHNQIRALHPWPHASALFRGKRVIIRRSWHGGALALPTADPGTIIDISNESITIATGAGALELRILQAEGRNAVTAREFASGHTLQVGERFESTLS